jgi:hypothetical protein
MKRYTRLAWTFLVLLLGGCSIIDHYTGEDTARKIRAEGLPATAKVLSIWDTGVMINNNPVVGFFLEVHAEGLVPWQAETKALISILEIPRIQPGAVLPVMYDPNDPSRVALDIRRKKPREKEEDQDQ